MVLSCRSILFIIISVYVLHSTLYSYHGSAVSVFVVQSSQRNTRTRVDDTVQSAPVVNSARDDHIRPASASTSDGGADDLDGTDDKHFPDLGNNTDIAMLEEDVDVNYTKPADQPSEHTGQRVGVCITGQYGRLELESKRQHLIAALRRRYRRVDVVFVLMRDRNTPSAKAASPSPSRAVPLPVGSVRQLTQDVSSASPTENNPPTAARLLQELPSLPSPLPSPAPQLPSPLPPMAAGLATSRLHTPVFAQKLQGMTIRSPSWVRAFHSTPEVVGAAFANLVSPFVRPSPYRGMNLTAVMADVADTVRVEEFVPSRELLIHRKYTSRLAAMGAKAGRSQARAQSHVMQWAMMHLCHDVFASLEDVPPPVRAGVTVPPVAAGRSSLTRVPPYDAFVRVRDDGFFVRKPDLSSVFVSGTVSVPKCDSYRGMNDKVSFFDRRAADAVFTAPLTDYYLHFDQLIGPHGSINAEQMTQRIFLARGLKIRMLPAAVVVVVPARYYAERGWCLKVVSAPCYGATPEQISQTQPWQLPRSTRQVLLRYNCWDLGTPPDPHLLSKILPSPSTVSLEVPGMGTPPDPHLSLLSKILPSPSNISKSPAIK
eukprot:TRINITY_DN21472_c0_g1_i1.p1 TRINITY_DN21472_c0_g1~~TRINITY_DN21472_c0_g1_i1.p1  ORF type:complete len:599 (-),score=70.38 TRINITY_DN21472_c0_g1_i1:175-1971(-)